MQHPGYLAVVGALWLEEGEAEQALIWLERSLLLDPGNLGTQADLALALSALGQPAALAELSRALRGRRDIPASLRDKLFPDQAANAPGAQLPRARLGQDTPSGWVSLREASVLIGRETNLDHSPRLTELTLTAPDGTSAQFPVISDPRAGTAALVNLSWQVARSPSAGQIWRSGIHLAARSTPAEGRTDWHHIQWVTSASRQWAAWRGQVELGLAWVGGPLSESYRLTRLGAAVDRQVNGCRWRFALEAEQRRQSTTRSADGTSIVLLGGNQCAVPLFPDWTWSTVLRAGLDKPASDDRPGGVQRLWNAALRLTGPVGADVRLDATARLGRVNDAEGYSPLLEYNARRTLTQPQLAVELSRPLHSDRWPGAEALLQWHAIRQSSNLALFNYDAQSIYAGIRWAW